MFKRVCDDFLLLPSSYKDALRSLLTDSFQIIDYARVPKFEDFKILRFEVSIYINLTPYMESIESDKVELSCDIFCNHL